MADYSFGSQMGLDDPDSDELGNLLTYGAKSDDETTGQPGGEPNVQSDASAPIAPADHIAAAYQDGLPPTAAPPVAAAAPATGRPPVVITPPNETAVRNANPVTVITPSPQAVSQAGQAPTYTPPDLTQRQKLVDQLAKDQIPSEIKPKIWERAVGGLSAAAMAFGKVPGAVEAGQAVTNRGQIAAEEQRQGRVDADKTQLSAFDDGLHQDQQTFQNQHTAFEDQDRATSRAQMNGDRAAQESQRQQAVAPGTEAPDDPKNPLGGWHATTVGGKQIALQGPPDKWAKSPAGLRAQRQADIDAERAKGTKISQQQETDYILNGKTDKTPVTNIRVPSEGQQSLSEAKAAWERENPGKKPSMADWRTIRATADGREDKSTSVSPTQWQDLLSKRDAAYRQVGLDRKKELETTFDFDKEKEVQEKYQSKLNDMQTEWNDRLSAADPEGKYDTKGNATAAPPAASAWASNTSQAARQPSIPNGQVKTYKGQQYIFNTKTNQYELSKGK